MIITVGTNLKEVYDKGLISLKTYNCCTKAGIRTISDLMWFRNGQPIIKMKGCGAKSALELNRLLDSEILYPEQDQDNLLELGQYSENLALAELYRCNVISVRAFNCCRYNDIYTIGDLSQYVADGHGLIDLRNCGKKTAKELEDVLKKVVFPLKPKQSDCDILFNSLPEQISEVVTDIYHNGLKSVDFDVSEKFRLMYDTPSKFYYLFEKGLPSFVTEFQKMENDGLQHYCYQRLVEICLKINSLGLSDTEQYKTLSYYKTIMLFVKEGLETESDEVNRISKLKKQIIESDYEDRANKLSARARRSQMSAMPNCVSVLTYFNSSQKKLEEDLFPGQTMRLTCKELFGFIQDFKTAFFQYLVLDESEVISKYISTKFPFLMKSQREFVYNFNLVHGHYPMFFILVQYLTSSENREDCVFAMLNGLFDGHRKTLGEIGELCGLSRERVRQIASEGPSRWLVESSEWEKYHMENNLVLFSESEILSKIIAEEKLEIDIDSVLTICSYVFPLSLKKTKGELYLIPKRLDSPKVLSSIYRQIERMMVVRYAKDYSYCIDGFLVGIPDENKKEEYKRLLLEIIRRAYKLEVDNDEYVVFPQIRIDYREELYQILRVKGEPLSLDELFYVLKQKYPEIKYESPNQIRSFVLNDERIKAIGRTSTYGLAEWQNVYYGSIRDLVIQILAENDNPVNIDDLMNQVLIYYPNTNRKSVVSNMYVEQEKFVSFIGGYYGLSNKTYDKKFVVSEDIARYSFEERFNQLEMFITTYNRFPFVSGGVEEGSIARWLWRTTNEQNHSYEQSQMDRLKELLKRYENLPQNGNEYEFLTNCKLYREFVETFFSLPRPNTNIKLYNWFRNAKNNYFELCGNRKKFFDELLYDLRSLEFDV